MSRTLMAKNSSRLGSSSKSVGPVRNAPAPACAEWRFVTRNQRQFFIELALAQGGKVATRRSSARQLANQAEEFCLVQRIMQGIMVTLQRRVNPPGDDARTCVLPGAPGDTHE